MHRVAETCFLVGMAVLTVVWWSVWVGDAAPVPVAQEAIKSSYSAVMSALDFNKVRQLACDCLLPGRRGQTVLQ